MAEFPEQRSLASDTQPKADQANYGQFQERAKDKQKTKTTQSELVSAANAVGGGVAQLATASASYILQLAAIRRNLRAIATDSARREAALEQVIREEVDRAAARSLEIVSAARAAFAANLIAGGATVQAVTGATGRAFGRQAMFRQVAGEREIMQEQLLRQRAIRQASDQLAAAQVRFVGDVFSALMSKDSGLGSAMNLLKNAVASGG